MAISATEGSVDFTVAVEAGNEATEPFRDIGVYSVVNDGEGCTPGPKSGVQSEKASRNATPTRRSSCTQRLVCLSASCLARLELSNGLDGPQV